MHFALLWGSVVTGLAAGWRIGVPLPLAIPIGLAIWLLGFLYNLSLVNRQRRRLPSRLTSIRHSYLRIMARSLMNLGVAIGSTTWLTLIAVAILVPLYTAAAHRRERYLDYVRNGMMSGAFPDRIVRH